MKKIDQLRFAATLAILVAVGSFVAVSVIMPMYLERERIEAGAVEISALRPRSEDNCMAYNVRDRAYSELHVCEAKTPSGRLLVYCALWSGNPPKYDPVVCTESWQYER